VPIGFRIVLAWMTGELSAPLMRFLTEKLVRPVLDIDAELCATVFLVALRLSLVACLAYTLCGLYSLNRLFLSRRLALFATTVMSPFHVGVFFVSTIFHFNW
jgi:hypothetical protein